MSTTILIEEYLRTIQVQAEEIKRLEAEITKANNIKNGRLEKVELYREQTKHFKELYEQELCKSNELGLMLQNVHNTTKNILEKAYKL